MRTINKNSPFVLLLLFLPFLGFGQQSYTLRQCKLLARENYPKLKQAELLKAISELKNSNTQSNYLPQAELKGQATYQSEVIEINIPVPGFEFDPVSKDQYKVYLDVKQTIWDGGVSKSIKELELAGLESSLQKLEIEAHQLNTMVENYYFNILLIDKSTAVLLTQKKVLDEQLEALKKAVSIGAVREKDKMKLEVEQLKLDQKKLELLSGKKSLLKMMSVLIGETIENDAKLELPETTMADFNSITRPEIKFFELQQAQLEQGDKLLSAGLQPKVFGFGQAGYGKPGFNMLKNEFDPYFIVGVGVSWKLTDWKNTRRNKEINARNREMLSVLKDDFLQKQQMQIVEAEEKIGNLNALIEYDQKLVDMRKSIAKGAASELENGTITSTDYLIDLNAETSAQINYEVHKIQLIQAKVNYNTILGY